MSAIRKEVTIGDCRLILGDCREMLALLDDNSVDSIVTDPPYGLKFMGKAWDHSVPSVDIWRECLRVLKPGGHLLAFFGTRTYHRGVVNIEDAGFEIRDQIAWVYGCLDDQTECLTSNGWKNYRDLSVQDQVLQWDSDTGGLSWTRPSEVLVYPFDGNLLHLRNRHIDQMLTDNHRVYARVRRHLRHPKPEAYEVFTARQIALRSASWQVDLPLAGELNAGEAYDPDFAYLVGWWLTDAWAHKDGKAAMFSQCKPATLAKLRDALRKYRPSEYVKYSKCEAHQNEHTFYLTGPAADRLLSEFPFRELDWRVMQWSREARQRLFDGLMDGDGSCGGEDRYAQCFWSQDQGRRDVFVALALSLGFRAYEDRKKGCVHVNVRTTTSQMQAKHGASLVPYQGEVWCLRVPTGAFVVRRNGRPFITGNSGFPKSHDVSKGIDKHLGAERQVVAEGKPVKRMIPGADQNKTGSWIKDNGREYVPTETAAGSPEAAQWEGWGTALKPAVEPIVVARKPLIGTVAENVLAWGVGGLNIDGCRVDGEPWTHPGSNAVGGVYGDYKNDKARSNDQGRWPANLIHDGSDEVLACFPDSKGQQGDVRGDEPSGVTDEIYGKFSGRVPAAKRGDSGSAARFFYCAKASKSDRNDGLDDFQPLPSAASEFRPNHTEKAAEGHDGNPYGRWKPLKNNHPTVKPTDLKRYLCRLVTPPGGTVLDPFMGSGSTGRGAVLEGFSFIGIEMEKAYIDISEARIAAARKLFRRVSKSCEQPDLFVRPPAPKPVQVGMFDEPKEGGK